VSEENASTESAHAEFRFSFQTARAQSLFVRHCASEAIHRAVAKVWIASSLALLAMTNTRLRSRRIFRASCANNVPPFSKRGRGECRVPGAPTASCAHGVVSMHTSIHSEFAEITRHPHAMVYSLFRTLPGDRAFLSPSSAKNFRQLDASVEASGPHGFAVRVSAVRYRHLHVHRIPSRVRDDRDTPLEWDGMAEDMPVIWVGREQKYFCGRGWTGNGRFARQAKLRNRLHVSRWSS